MQTLGFKQHLNPGYQSAAIYNAMNTAIAEVNIIDPLTETVKVLHYPIKPNKVCNGIIVHSGGNAVDVTAENVKALKFRATGTGRATLTEAGSTYHWTIEWTDLTDYEEFGGIVRRPDRLPATDTSTNRFTLTFEGEYLYHVKDVTFYDDISSEFDEDVYPYSEFIEYDMSSEKYLGGLFNGFKAVLPSTTDYLLEDSAILFPRCAPGVYTVECFRKLAKVTADNLADDITINSRLTPLLALRAAYYLYRDEDEVLANSYNADYLKMKSEYVKDPTKKTPPHFINRRGW